MLKVDGGLQQTRKPINLHFEAIAFIPRHKSRVFKSSFRRMKMVRITVGIAIRRARLKSLGYEVPIFFNDQLQRFFQITSIGEIDLNLITFQNFEVSWTNIETKGAGISQLREWRNRTSQEATHLTRPNRHQSNNRHQTGRHRPHRSPHTTSGYFFIRVNRANISSRFIRKF